jgi:hypothetical protein
MDTLDPPSNSIYASKEMAWHTCNSCDVSMHYSSCDHPSVALFVTHAPFELLTALTHAMLLLSLSLPCTCLQYEGGEPCSICGHVMLPPGTCPHESCMPATIISGTLYLGNYDTASRQDLLKAMGITHVLNVSMCTCYCAQLAVSRPCRTSQHKCSSASAQMRQLQG